MLPCGFWREKDVLKMIYCNEGEQYILEIMKPPICGLKGTKTKGMPVNFVCEKIHQVTKATTLVC